MPFHETLGLVCLHDVYSTRSKKQEYAAAQNPTHTHTQLPCNFHPVYRECVAFHVCLHQAVGYMELKVFVGSARHMQIEDVLALD
jgi:hypothetical protein